MKILYCLSACALKQVEVVRGVFVAAGMFFAAIAVPAFAQTVPIISDTQGAHNEICNVFNTMFFVLIGITVIMVMWAGYLYVTARDDAEQITEAKKSLYYAAFGVAAALIAKGFPLVVASVFPRGSTGVQGC